MLSKGRNDILYTIEEQQHSRSCTAAGKEGSTQDLQPDRPMQQSSSERPSFETRDAAVGSEGWAVGPEKTSGEGVAFLQRQRLCEEHIVGIDVDLIG